MASEGAAHVREPLAQSRGIVPFGQLVGEVAHQALRVAVADERRHLAHHHGARTEALQHQAEIGQLAGP